LQKQEDGRGMKKGELEFAKSVLKINPDNVYANNVVGYSFRK
jgi:hypothetical protein